MANTYTNLLYHLVFSTKNRVACIGGEIQEPLYQYIGGVIRGEGGTLIEIGGVADHVHLLARFKASVAVATMVRRIKTSSSKWMSQRPGAGPKFAWQTGYGAFSVSESQVGQVRRYIQNQAEHHRRRTFQEELREILDKHHVEFDERYLWD
ncbi:MAG: IS200/IS605 family transposase [bacterium]|nr:IS200/IS605 family transposase [bacterium]